MTQRVVATGYAKNPSLALLASDPDYLLFDLLPGGKLRFVAVSTETYRCSTFLDERLEPQPSASFTCLSDHLYSLAADNRFPDLLIAHTSFCGSTLLAKCLQSESLLVLREPKALGTLAAALRVGDYDMQRKNKAVAITARLLGKRYTADQCVALKLSNFTNNLLPEFLELLRTPKIVLMYGGLKDFLVSMLNHKVEAERHLDLFLAAFQHDHKINDRTKARTRSYSMLEKAVWVWYLQMEYFMDLWNRYRPAIYAVSRESFLSIPAKIVQRSCRLIDLKEDAAAVQSRVEAVMNVSAKNPNALGIQVIAEREKIADEQCDLICRTLDWASGEIDAAIGGRLASTIPPLVAEYPGTNSAE